MPLPGRIFADDEELGKKNDDHRPANGTIPIHAWSWTRWKATPKIRRRRLLVGIVVGVILYFFFQNIPTDLVPIAQRMDIRIPGRTFNGIPLGTKPGQRVGPQAPSGQPPFPEGYTASEKPYYNGQIKFYNLAVSLHSIAKTMGYRDHNKNVLFAAGNLQSAARLIPTACEMSRWNRNTVHFMFVGRDDLPMEDIRMVNGVTPECDIYWHDARPDFSLWSTDSRMELSTIGALGHIQAFMHPQVYLIDDPGSEEAFFVRAIRLKAYETGKSLIELPNDALQRIPWVSRLDYGSLAAWSNVYIEILIHAPPHSSGSIIRLLKSVEKADYFGSRRPHLTIELPSDIDPSTEAFLENLVWPPLDLSKSPRVSQVTIRHRIPRQNMGTEDAAVYFIQSFYSARPQHSHVLVLSPQVELSPLYYQYLLYNILEYRYSAYGSNQDESDKLMGISLDLPLRYLNDSQPFQPPLSKSINEFDYSTVPPHDEETLTSPFLWQAPNSNAALYFGDKWTELHSFLASRLSAHTKKPTARRKHISPNYPAWTEYLLEFMRARGYSLLYPNIPSSDSLATVHNELYQPPEEYTPPPETSNDRFHSPSDHKEPFLTAPSSPLHPHEHLPESSLLTTPLLAVLPNEGDLPEISSLPYLSYSGELLTPFAAQQQALRFADEFKREVGGCAPTSNKPVLPMKADDLFCVDNEESPSDAGQKLPTFPHTVEDATVPTHPAGFQSTPEEPENPNTAEEFAAHLARQAKGA